MAVAAVLVATIVNCSAVVVGGRIAFMLTTPRPTLCIESCAHLLLLVRRESPPQGCSTSAAHTAGRRRPLRHDDDRPDGRSGLAASASAAFFQHRVRPAGAGFNKMRPRYVGTRVQRSPGARVGRVLSRTPRSQQVMMRIGQADHPGAGHTPFHPSGLTLRHRFVEARKCHERLASGRIGSRPRPLVV
jgi:hypothetical protein